MEEKLVDFVTGVKGAMAEGLITMLFRHSGYAIKLHGSWKAVDLNPSPKSKLYVGDGKLYPTTNHPDLIISKRGKKELVEVKYRKGGHLYSPYKSNQKLKSQCVEWGDQEKVGVPLSVIIVSQKEGNYLTVLKSPHLSRSGWFNKRIPLMEGGWELNQDLYDECIRLLKSGLFDGVNSS